MKNESGILNQDRIIFKRKKNYLNKQKEEKISKNRLKA